MAENVVKHAYQVSFDEQGRISIYPCKALNTTELDDYNEQVSVIYGGTYTPEQRALMLRLGELLTAGSSVVDR